MGEPSVSSFPVPGRGSTESCLVSFRMTQGQPETRQEWWPFPFVLRLLGGPCVDTPLSPFFTGEPFQMWVTWRSLAQEADLLLAGSLCWQNLTTRLGSRTEQGALGDKRFGTELG